MTYQSDTSEGPTAGTETTDPLAFLARVRVHSPGKGLKVPVASPFSGRQRGGAGRQIADPVPRCLRARRLHEEPVDGPANAHRLRIALHIADAQQELDRL